jgi:microcystin-dependent protein
MVVVPAAVAQIGFNPNLGEIMPVPYNFAPKGWALCQGQILAINQNTALFSLLGTQYGGDGRTTFALPDLRGRSAIGMGQGPGLTSYSQGETGGEESVTLVLNQMPSHTHTAMGTSAVVSSPDPGGNVWATQTRTRTYSATADSAMAPGTIGSTGNNQPHNNLSPYLTLNYVIALQGIYPARQ